MSDKRIQAELASDSELQYLATKTINYRRDLRFQDLDLKDAHCNGTVYNAKRRPFDWDGSPATADGTYRWPRTAPSESLPPVFLRRPLKPFFLADSINNRFVTLLFGQHRFPYISVPHSKNTENFINQLFKGIQMKAHMIEAATIGGAVGSVIVMFKVVDGVFEVESFNPKWCTIVWENFHKGTMKGFSFAYPQIREEYNPESDKFENKRYLYRRVITQNSDIVFHPMPLKMTRDDTEVIPVDPKAKPRIDEAQSFYHGLGFVPAVFIQNIPRSTEIDGKPNADKTYEIIDRMNETMSGAYCGLQANLDPTLVLMIGADDYKALQAVGGVVGTGATGEAICVGDKGNAKYLEIEGTGIDKAIDSWCKDRESALEIAQCVIPDPERITGIGQSGSAMSKMYEPMLGKCDILRTQYGDRGLKRLAVLMLRARTLLNGKMTLTADGTIIKTVFKPVRRVVEAVESGGEPSFEVLEPEDDITEADIELKWGMYFRPTADDVFKITEAANMATGKPVTSTRIAALFAAPYFDDHDPTRTLGELEHEEEATRQHELEMAKAGKKPPGAPAKPAKGRSNP